MASSPTHQISIRIPAPLRTDVQRLARRRKTSINRLALEGLEEAVRSDRMARLQAAYDSLAAPDSDVEPFRSAQAEVVSNGR